MLPAACRPAVLVTYVIAALLGVVQGLTEFLPVSSTAHLLVAARFLGYDDPGGAFTVMIQLGSILAIVWLYRARLVAVVRGLPSDRDARHFALMLLVAVVPALVAGAFLADYVQVVLYESLRVIAGALIAGGVMMLLVERSGPRRSYGMPTRRRLLGPLASACARCCHSCLGCPDRVRRWSAGC